MDLLLYQHIDVLYQWVGFLLYMFIMLCLWKLGRLELATNLAVIAGLGFAVYLFKEHGPLRFYMQLLIVMLVVTAGYIKRYQFVLTYSAFAILIVSRIVYDMDLQFTQRSYFAEQYILILGFLAVIVCIDFLKRASERELQISSKLKVALNYDDLTGLPNRRRFHEIYDIVKDGEPVMFMILDLDHFKIINDSFGHIEGDTLLEEVGKILDSNTRSLDQAFRWGGEEFVVFSKLDEDTDVEAFANRIRLSIQNHQFKLDTKVTISIGVTKGIKSETFLHEALMKADEALYAAKKDGRNNVKSLY
jgi:diguanylate cyclase (GGDEF)-like protein